MVKQESRRQKLSLPSLGAQNMDPVVFGSSQVRVFLRFAVEHSRLLGWIRHQGDFTLIDLIPDLETDAGITDHVVVPGSIPWEFSCLRISGGQVPVRHCMWCNKS